MCNIILATDSLSCRPDASSGVRLLLGMFAIFPACGNVMPGNQQVINVECSADNVGVCDEVRFQSILDLDF